MSYNFSIILIERAFNARLSGKDFVFDVGDAILVKASYQTDFLAFSEFISELKISEKIVKSFLKKNIADCNILTMPSCGCIKIPFSEPVLFREIIYYLQLNDSTNERFVEQLFFSCISVFSSNKELIPLFLNSITSTTHRVEYVILSDISRQWKLKDICDKLFTSESLLKKKLKDEKTSFSQLLLENRMMHARRLLIARLPINIVANRCGYLNASYFITVFRQYYGTTPSKILSGIDDLMLREV